jgi:hypothetical protein
MSSAAPALEPAELSIINESGIPPSAVGIAASPAAFDEAAPDTHLELEGLLDDPILHVPLPEDEVEDDGLHQLDDDIHADALDFSDEGSFGDEEEVDVGADAYLWKIDRHQGHHHLRGKAPLDSSSPQRADNVHSIADQFLSTVCDPYFDGTRALEMLHQRYTIDYGSRKTGSRPAGSQDEYHPLFFLDMLIIVGRPLHPISQINERFFDNVTISFKNWRASYQAKHIYGFNFSLQNRTFRIATAATRESWFIVMHPRTNTMTELPHSHREHRRRLEESSRSSALQLHHAQFLATYIKQVFHLDQLLGEGVEASWSLDGPQSQNITFNKWTVFQQHFMQNWETYVTDNSTDSFWQQHSPAFHAYDYGANIEIVVNDYVQSLTPEASIRPANDDESDASVDDDRDPIDSTFSFANDSFFLPEESATASHHGGETAAANFRPTSSVAPSPNTSVAPVVAPAETPVNPSTGASVAPSTAASAIYSVRGLPTESFPAGLRQLHDELSQKYIIDNLQSISFALATDINCLDSTSTAGEDQRRPARCLLADRNLVSQEFRGARDFTFYPLAFHPAYGNFSSSRPPSFLNDRVLAVMRDNLSYLNEGTDPLTYGFFQAYSNIKRSIRHGPDDLLATKGIATASLAFSENEARASPRLQSKRQRLRRQLLGALSPDDPDASRPFARERRRVETALEGEEFAFRMEQVIHVQLDRLQPVLRHFTTVLQPIFQMMRFFIQEPDHYTGFLRSFPPSIFPGVLISFAHLFDKALIDLRQRIDQRGPQGATVALAEGVAAIDRLGSYCFTGFPRSLMGSVLKPLGTIGSIAQGGWPYLDPRLLDLSAPLGELNFPQWPRGDKNRPILMHVTAIAYHYGEVAAVSRHNHVWFHELGGCDLTGPSGITKFLQDFFESLWVPQMVAFVSFQLNRLLREEQRHAEFLDTSALELDAMRQRQEQLETWAQSARPFSWREYEPLVSNVITPLSRVAVQTTTKARQDFSRELYRFCRGEESRGHGGISSPNATWLSILRRIVQSVPSAQVATDHWIAALSAATLSHGIECMPGLYQSRLSHRRVIRLIGYATPAVILSAPAGSLKRAALEAQDRVKRARIQSRIDFGSRLPFSSIPDLVRDGFDGLEKQFQRGNRRVLEHYRVARNCLEECLGSPQCDLLLMIVMSFASCSVTPTVLPNTKEFTVGQRRGAGSFAASLTTRMLWFLCPNHFPWQEDWPKILRVSEMTKKLEHKGVHNRLLRQIGWVKVIAGNRDTPRNSDLELQDMGQLLQMRKNLVSLMKDAPSFIRLIFQSHDPVWVDRCSQIIKAED